MSQLQPHSAMDNRRVMKAYRDRTREKVLAPPARAGLFAKVKRYLSVGSLPNSASQQSRSATEPIDINASTAGRSRADSFAVAANNTTLDADQTTNRILLNFFQEKGDTPLTEVEYEGVMSLLEKSKANITMPLLDTHDHDDGPDHGAVADSTAAESRHNHTFAAPYSQKVLRNTSMYDANSTTLATPDYKPVYHTFNDTSLGNVSVKRVYQFSGLPSPYRTRIRAPNLSARRAKRLASTAGASTTHATASGADELAEPKQLSNTANSLLSILDRGVGAEVSATDGDSKSKPLHNPFARGKRKTPISLEPASKRAAVLGASDITKTVLHSNVDELEEQKSAGAKAEQPKSASPEKKPEEPTSLFGNSKPVAATPDEKATAPKEAQKPSLFNTTLPKNGFGFGEKKPEPAEAPAASTFSFGPKATASTPLFGNGTATGLSNGSKKAEETETAPKTTFGFGAKAADSEKPALFQLSLKTAPELDSSKPLFGFGTATKADAPTFNFDANPDASKTKVSSKPAFSFGNKSEEKSEQAKPAFSFGKSTEEKPEPTKPAFSFGKSSEEKPEPAKPSFSFGNKSEEKSEPAKTSFSFGGVKTNDKPETTKPAFSFGASKPEDKPETAKPAFSFGKTEEKASISFGAPKADSKTDDKPAFSFGAASSAPQPEQPKAPGFSFGKPSSEATKPPAFLFGKPAPSNGAPSSNGNGAHADVTGGQFQFPPVKVVNVEVDDKKVEEYKSLFQF